MAKKHHGGPEHKMGKHHGPATKKAPHAKQEGSKGNLHLPSSSQSIHVKPQADHMAHNVGGDDHMQVDSKSMGHQNLMLSGGKSAPKKAKLKY